MLSLVFYPYGPSLQYAYFFFFFLIFLKGLSYFVLHLFYLSGVKTPLSEL